MTFRTVIYGGLALFLLAVGALFGQVITRAAAYADGHRDGTAQMRAAWALGNERAKVLGLELNRAREAADIQRTQHAQQTRIATQQALALAAADHRRELDGLRDELAASRGAIRTASADAVRAYAATATVVFEDCARRYSALAATADGHAADALMFEQAWPTEEAQAP